MLVMVSKGPGCGILNFTRRFYKILFIAISKLIGGQIFFLIISLIPPPSRHLRGQSHHFLVPRFATVKMYTALI